MIDANDQERDINIPAYSNLVPSLNISKSIGKASILKLAYNKRIPVSYTHLDVYKRQAWWHPAGCGLRLLHRPGGRR